jgi:hypothetical protein
VTFVAKSEALSSKCRLGVCCTIDEKHGVGDVVFLAAFAKRRLRRYGRMRRKEPNTEESVRVEIDCRVRPLVVAVDPNHRLVTFNVIRVRTACGL